MTRTLLIALVTLAGCGDSLSQIVLEVDTNLSPSELGPMRILVTGPSGDVSVDYLVRFDVPDAPTLPLTLGLVLDESADADRVSVRVHADEATVGAIAASARTDFLRGQSRVLRLRLDADCADVLCSDTQSCTMGICASDRINPETLPTL